ncbi:MAG: hypothetical protein WA063_04575 [Minisyncoccia bacterium]
MDVNKKIKTNNNKKNATLILIIIVVASLFLYIAIMTGLNERSNSGNNGNMDNTGNTEEKRDKITEYFPDCGILSDDCLDVNCDKYFLCNDKEYKTCKIYDCGKDYGIGTIDADGKLSTSRKIKYDEEGVRKMIEKCKGDIDVLKNECIGENREMEVQVSTNGQCEITGFLAIGKKQSENEENKVNSGKFSIIAENSYKVTFDTCENMSEIIAIGNGGVSIKKEL